MKHSSQKSFLAALEEVDQSFTALKPEYELSVYDRKHKMEGYLVVWNTIHDPAAPLGRCAKGGTRITPAVSLDEVRMLARIMALKNAAAGLPLGGAKSGLRADPDAADFESTYKCFVRSMKNSLNEFGGLYGGFGFDIGARPIHPSWAMEVLGSGRSFTGKTLELGGTDYDKEGLAGFGVAIAARTWLEQTNQEASAITFSVQGLGAMGAAVIKYFSGFGARPTYISDPRIGGAFKLKSELSNGFLTALGAMDFDTTNKLLKDFAEEKIALEQILFQKVDICFPCAVQDVITSNNVNQIQARAVVEGANNPCTPEARTQMFSNNITVIPDFVANAGGIIAAYVEMTSKVTPEENVRTRANVIAARNLTEERISANVRTILAEAQELNVEPALVARYYALQRVLL